MHRVPKLDDGDLMRPAHLGTGTPSASTALFGDQTWKVPGGAWLLGELKAMPPAVVTMPDGWYMADGGLHNSYQTIDMVGYYAKGGMTAATGGALTHQHPAMTAGTPAGTVGAIAAVSIPEQKGLSGSGASGIDHAHPAPSFTGSELPAHQHDAGSSEPPHQAVKWWQFCGVA